MRRGSWLQCCHSCCWHRLLGTAQRTLPAIAAELLRVSSGQQRECGLAHCKNEPSANPPSTVTTWHPSTAYMGHRQAFTARCWTLPCCQLDTMTVHAPHPPSPHPSLVPVRPCSAQQQANAQGGGCRMCEG